jgi:gluconate 2-dehydrogenase gamma chain
MTAESAMQSGRTMTDEVRQPAGGSLSRRTFLRTSSLVGGASLVACTSSSVGIPPEQLVSAPDRPPLPPDRPPGVYEFFTPTEARTIEAVAARILPGSADDPGAREAGVVIYIDAKLARFDQFAEPTYWEGPFAEGYEGARPADRDDVVLVPQDQLYRYGPQSGTTPQELYRQGIPALDDYARQRYNTPFADLAADLQDEVLRVLDAVAARSEQELQEGGSPPGAAGGPPPTAELDRAEQVFGDTDPGSFFETVRDDTIQGMFADPVYGGNRGLVGWTLIGYPGPQRSYSPREMRTGTRRTAQSLDGLPPMNPGRPHEHAHDPMEKPRSGG